MSDKRLHIDPNLPRFGEGMGKGDRLVFDARGVREYYQEEHDKAIRADERTKTLKAVGEWLQRQDRPHHMSRGKIVSSVDVDEFLDGRMPE